MLKAALNQEVAKTVNHQGVGLSDDSLDYFVFLFRSADFQLLLEEDGGLLVVVTDNLVDDILPVAVDIPV